MIPDSENRYQQARLDLEEFLQGLDDSLMENEWYAVAQELLDAKGGDAGEVATTNVDDLAEGEAF